MSRAVLVSACLLGEPVRYDARPVPCEHPALAEWRMAGIIVPCCPELLGGLPAPRDPAEIVGASGAQGVIEGTARVVGKSGVDMTEAFVMGAHESVALALRLEVVCAVLKSYSPSCGSGLIYDGTFSHTRIPGNGVAAHLLRQAGIAVFSDENLDEAAEFYRAFSS